MGVGLLPAAALPVCQRGLDQALEQGMGPVGAGLELGMELARHKEVVLGQLHSLYNAAAASTVSR